MPLSSVGLSSWLPMVTTMAVVAAGIVHSVIQLARRKRENQRNVALKRYIEKLWEQARPSLYDDTHHVYVDGGNKCIKHFCGERMLVLGSTGEKLKLTSTKDLGDVDIILCSGRIEIPVENIEHRKDTPCFIWINCNNLQSKLKVNLINGIYLPSDLLREFGTELFTFGRGVVNIFARAIDYVRKETPRNTVFRNSSRVGLATTEYCGLKFVKEFSPELKNALKAMKTKRNKREKEEMIERRKSGQFDKKEIECIEVNFFDLLLLFQVTGKIGSRKGQFQHFIHTLELGRLRLKEIDSMLEMPCAEEDVCAKQSNVDVLENDQQAEHVDMNIDDKEAQNIKTLIQHEIDKMPDKIEATYEKKRSKDFVPAFKINGKLPAMDEWKSRDRLWPSKDDVEEIYNTEIYIVSKNAPKYPDDQRDFCLSFNMAEIKLAECMTYEMRTTLLIMKSYLKGTIANEYKTLDRQSRLTTFHLKTALYWLAEKREPATWSTTSVIESVRIILLYLKEALLNKQLLHFFVPSNLFEGFDGEDFELLLTCFERILEDPVQHIQCFFNLDDGLPVNIQFSKEDIVELMDVPLDEASYNEGDIVADAFIDMQRGIKEGPEASEGTAPIKKALLALLGHFIESEYQHKLIRWIHLTKPYPGTLLQREAKILLDLQRDVCMSALERYIHCNDMKMKINLREDVSNNFRTYFYMKH